MKKKTIQQSLNARFAFSYRKTGDRLDAGAIITIFPKLSEVLLIEGENNYSKVFLAPQFAATQSLSQSQIRIAKNIGYFAARLPSRYFFRVSKNALVNLMRAIRLENGTIYLDMLQKPVFISPHQIKKFKERMIAL